MDDKAFYIIYGWMRNRLKLDNLDLQVYAFLYAFCQGKEGKFSGSAQYIADSLNRTRRSVMTSLGRLAERKLIRKQTVIRNGNRFCDYSIVKGPEGYEDNFIGCEETFTTVMKKSSEGCEETFTTVMKPASHHNIEIIKDNNLDKRERAHSPKKKYGELQNVLLTDEEYLKLADDFSQEIRNRYIEDLSNYIGSTGKKYKSHYFTIRNWIRRDVEKQNNEPKSHTEKIDDFLMAIARGDIEI